jgi:predicted nuclease of predicted toxin-antitoxin system
MKIKLDENLPSGLVIPLERLGHEVDTVHEENLTGRPDVEVWEAAQQESRFLVTQDLDFSDLRHFSLGSHDGILLLRLRSADRKSLLARVEEIFQTEYVDDWAGCFVVASERKIRLLKPPNKQNS